MDRAASRRLSVSRPWRVSHSLPQSTIHNHVKRAKLASRSEGCQSASSYTVHIPGHGMTSITSSNNFTLRVNAWRNNQAPSTTFFYENKHFEETHMVVKTDQKQTGVLVFRDICFDAERFQFDFPHALIQRTSFETMCHRQTPPMASIDSTGHAMRLFRFSALATHPVGPTLFKHARRNSPFGISAQTRNFPSPTASNEQAQAPEHRIWARLDSRRH